MSSKLLTEEKDYGIFKHKFVERQANIDVKYALDIGGPGVDLLRSASRLMMKASQIRLQKESSGDGDLLQYGSLLGDPAYRTNLATFLSKHYMDTVDPRSLLTTSGASSGLSFITSTFFNAGDFIFIEDPTFFQVNRIVGIDLGLKTVPIPLLHDGIDMEILEKEIERRKPKEFQPTTERPFWALMYALTVYHNPTGVCYSKEKCEMIVKLARVHNLLVICDDVYNILCYEKNGESFERAPPRLFQYDVKSDEDYFGNVVSNGSFSKLLGPGLRLGWIEAPEVVLSKLMDDGCLNSGGSLNHFTSGIVGDSLHTDLFNDYILMVRNTGKMKLDAVVDVLQRHCPNDVKYSIPKGGYFIWMELPSSIDIHELNEFCKKTHKIQFHQGIKCSTSGSCRNCLRICFMYYSADELVEAVTTLLAEVESRLKKEKGTTE